MSEKDDIDLTSASVRTLYLIKSIEKSARVLLIQTLNEFRLTPGEYLIMNLANRPNPLSSAQIARRTFSTPQATRVFINSLESKKLIERFADPDNKRILRIKLTAEGLNTLDACNKVIDELEADYLRELDSEEVASLRKALFKLQQSQRKKN